jgi:hypothetical protein
LRNAPLRSALRKAAGPLRASGESVVERDFLEKNVQLDSAVGIGKTGN